MRLAKLLPGMTLSTSVGSLICRLPFWEQHLNALDKALKVEKRKNNEEVINHMQNTQSVKRIFTFILALLAAAALFGGLVHVVLVATHLSEPATTTVYGPTTQRFWASAAVVLALAS